ncbi:ATP-binding protein [Streptomyces sp. XD-27]|uniref:ATP-binding protein n=1 Tax=Streptomyces sp. XD-27 TaxID=3062779 RepID=UPI0026F4187E|nr:ATP-binding protein [Streptomyces sp. XD-27]WKX70945.1 ATP-binding protein [Streptomyces sp. XD-27]
MDRPHSYTLYCPPLETSPRIARDFVQSALRRLRLEDVAPVAALCTSEVATNAYLHAPGLGSLLWLAVEVGEVRITVYDGNRDEPVLRPTCVERESGRGLRLVDGLADAWGTSPGAPLGVGGREGKGVWFTLATPSCLS